MYNSLLNPNLIRPLIYLLVVLCATVTLMPGVEAGGSAWLLKFDYFLSFLISPVIAVVALFIFFLKYPKQGWQEVIANRTYVSASILVCLAILFSYVMNGVRSKETFVAAINFLSMSLFLLLVVRRYASEKIIGWSMWILALWAILPMFALLFTASQPYVLQIPCDFQGMADGRLLYGFWAGVGLILLLNTASETPFGKRVIFAALSLIWLGLVFGRIRAAMVAIAASLVIMCLYENWRKIRKVILFALWLILILMVATPAWRTLCANGMERPFEMDYSEGKPKWKMADNEKAQGKEPAKLNSKKSVVRKSSTEQKVVYSDPVRTRIYTLFWQDVQANWLIGHGKMNLIHVPGAGVDGMGTEADAHNALLQFLSNYGVVGLTALIFWLLAFYLSLHSNRSRMLFVYLVVYSQFQPVFGGTTNMFAVLPLLVFLLIMAADSERHNGGELLQVGRPT